MLNAYLNHGRWVADCECYSGIKVDGGGGLYRCGECLTLWQIAMPPEVSEIERLVAKRPMRNRNWLVGESVGMLMAENLEHGLAPGWALKAADK